MIGVVNHHLVYSPVLHRIPIPPVKSTPRHRSGPRNKNHLGLARDGVHRGADIRERIALLPPTGWSIDRQSTRGCGRNRRGEHGMSHSRNILAIYFGRHRQRRRHHRDVPSAEDIRKRTMLDGRDTRGLKKATPSDRRPRGFLLFSAYLDEFGARIPWRRRHREARVLVGDGSAPCRFWFSSLEIGASSGAAVCHKEVPAVCGEPGI